MCEMSRLIRNLQLIDAHDCKYFAANKRRRFLEAARLAPRHRDQTFALTVARVSKALAIRSVDVDLEATSIRIRTLKRCAERFHALRSTQAKASPPRLRHRDHHRWCATVDDRGRPGPRQPADHRGLYHHRKPRGTRFSAPDVGARTEFGPLRCLKTPGEGP